MCYMCCVRAKCVVYVLKVSNISGHFSCVTQPTSETHSAMPASMLRSMPLSSRAPSVENLARPILARNWQLPRHRATEDNHRNCKQTKQQSEDLRVYNKKIIGLELAHFEILLGRLIGHIIMKMHHGYLFEDLLLYSWPSSSV